MTDIAVLAREIAAALLDGDWTPSAMRARLRSSIAAERQHWITSLVRSTRRRYKTPDGISHDELASWVYGHDIFRESLAGRPHVVHYTTTSPTMFASPWPVPSIATVGALATWLGIDGHALTVLADQAGISRASPEPRAHHYHYAWIGKPSGGHRLVEAPKPRLRGVQRRILDGILAHIPPHEAAHGFRAGRSVITFAHHHVAREVVIRVDLQAFFSSVFAARVLGMLRTAGYPVEVAYAIAALCTHRTPPAVLRDAPERDPIDLARLRTPHLPQGAPTSGALANLAAYRLDVRLAALARKLDATYTRYADDLVLSGDRALARAAPAIVARIAAIASEEGFSLNFRKTRVMTSSQRQRITGIVVNDKLAVARTDVEQLRAILHNCRRHGPTTQNRDNHADFRSHLRGRIAWVHSVDPAKGARLVAIFDQIAWDEPAVIST